MQCPVDQTQLVIADRQGIEIDYCPKCRGVWLDRGELDKLIERSSSFSPAPQPQQQPHQTAPRGDYSDRDRRHYDDDDDDHYEHRGHQGHGHGKHHKKESFLGDLFDF